MRRAGDVVVVLVVLADRDGCLLKVGELGEAVLMGLLEGNNGTNGEDEAKEV